MKKDEVDNAPGEGSYSATRHYNQHLAESVQGGDLESGAEEALRAVSGPEAKDLKHAEEQGKRGPKLSAPSPPRRVLKPL